MCAGGIYALRNPGWPPWPRVASPSSAHLTAVRREGVEMPL